MDAYVFPLTVSSHKGPADWIRSSKDLRCTEPQPGGIFIYQKFGRGHMGVDPHDEKENSSVC